MLLRSHTHVCVCVHTQRCCSGAASAVIRSSVNDHEKTENINFNKKDKIATRTNNKKEIKSEKQRISPKNKANLNFSGKEGFCFIR